MEFEFDQLRYAGVTDVAVGLADDGIEAVQVTYDPMKMSYVKLLRTYWKNCKPTQAGGQYRDVGCAPAVAWYPGPPALSAT